MKSFVTKKKKYLFLHLGPGGDSSLERVRLERKADIIDFWDQPVLPIDDCTFENLLKACIDRYDSEEYSGVIGHSFGCEIARRMVGRTARPINELLFLSPLQDLALGFASFAKHLGDHAVAASLKNAVNKRVGHNSPPEEMEKFWAVIQAIVTNPGFARGYWATERAWNEHQSIQHLLTPLNMQMWQCGIEDFLKHHDEAPSLSAVSRKSVFLGAKDPFYEDVQAEKKYWEQLGFVVSILEDVGHYTHVEGNAL